jgi:hypothetical protein
MWENWVKERERESETEMYRSRTCGYWPLQEVRAASVQGPETGHNEHRN